VKHTCAACLTAICAVAVQASILLAQGTFHFEDDFNRDPWDNAQTNTALPAWSTPGTIYTPPTDGSPILAEVVVNGTSFQIRLNNETYLDLTDADLGTGSVGIMSWAQRGGAPYRGTVCENLKVLNALSQVILQEDWQLPSSVPTTWTQPALAQADGTAAIEAMVKGAFEWDFITGSIVENSGVYAWATSAGAHTDFIGPILAYNGAGANDWTDYRVRTRIVSIDNDGIGLIVRYREETGTTSFYRITFCAQATGTGVTRAYQGVSIQKAVYDKIAKTAQWTDIGSSNSFVYTMGVMFDVAVTVRNNGGQTDFAIDVIDDPKGAATVIPTINLSDPTNPITAGSAGLQQWGNNSNRWFSYGGTDTPFVETLDATPVTLLGNIFPAGYANWVSIYDSSNWLDYFTSGTTFQDNLPAFGITLDTQDLMEASDGRYKPDSTVATDGKYTPFYLYKSAFNADANYTLQASLRSFDDDGFGLIFGYQNESNYFRVGLRAQAAANYGFATGISVQKIVGGTVSQIALVTTKPTRGQMAGLWVQKFATGAIEMSENPYLYDAAHNPGIEFQGPRLVRGDVNWTDYTWETVIEAQDNDGIGLLFRYQDEKNFYRLTFQSEAQTTLGAPVAGIGLQRAVDGVYSELFRDIDPTKAGDNDVDATSGFIYSNVQSAVGYKIWRPRIVAVGGTFRLEIDAILTDGTEYKNYYTATVTDPAPLTHGKVGIHTWGHNANEFRDFKLTLAGNTEPEFFDGHNNADVKGWVDATIATMSDPAAVVDAGPAAGSPISGFGISVNLNALSVRDNRYILGTNQDPDNLNAGTVDFDGPRAVVGSTGWADYIYSVDVRTLDNDGLGIVFRYLNENNFYRLMFMNQDGNNLGPPPRGVSVQKRLNGTYSKVFWSGDGGDEFIYTPGERWHVDLVAQGGNFAVKVTQLNGDVDGDGKTEYNFAFSDPTDPILTGKVGVTSWGSRQMANEANTILGGLDWTKNFVEGAVFDNVVVDGTRNRVAPDLNDDTFIDAADFQLWSACFTGPEIPLLDPTETCSRSDVDVDGDVDQDDFGLFQRCYSGTGRAFDPHCVD